MRKEKKGRRKVLTVNDHVEHKVAPKAVGKWQIEELHVGLQALVGEAVLEVLGRLVAGLGGALGKARAARSEGHLANGGGVHVAGGIEGRGGTTRGFQGLEGNEARRG